MPNFSTKEVQWTTEYPSYQLQQISEKNSIDVNTLHFADLLDKQDPLAHFRHKFDYPKKSLLPHIDLSLIEDADEECVYLCGNSLGLKPKTTDVYMNQQLNKWGTTGVEMHFQEPLPAALCDTFGKEYLGRLVGADPQNVTLMNSLTVNLHLLLISFYQPTAERNKILIEKNAFPSDRYAVRSQVSMRGFDPEKAVLEIGPRENEDFIRCEDILKLIEEEGSNIAVICLSGVQYYTGQKFDMKLITEFGHRYGCIVGYDLAHAIGNVELCLQEWDVDFACWCTYKYLNGGPGCIGGAFVNKQHDDRKSDHLLGWWSNKAETRFMMRDDCDLASGVDAFKLSNPSPMLVCCVIASLEIFDDAGMDRLLAKQKLLTGYLEALLDKTFDCGASDSVIRILTPRDPNQRGCQLSLEFSQPLNQVLTELQRRGVVCDVRKPNVLRIAPVPLYNSFKDVFKFVKILQESLRMENYLK